MSAPQQAEHSAPRSSRDAPTDTDAGSNADTESVPVSPPYDSITVSRQGLQDLVQLISYPADVDLFTEASANAALRAAYLRLLRDADAMITKAETIGSGASGAGFKPRTRSKTDRELEAMTPELAGRFKLLKPDYMAYAATSVEGLKNRCNVLEEACSQQLACWVEAQNRIRSLESCYWHEASLLLSSICNVLSWVGSELMLNGKEMASNVLGAGRRLYERYSTVATTVMHAGNKTETVDGNITTAQKEKLDVTATRMSTGVAAMDVANPDQET